MPVIGFAGYATSGKDSAANFVVDLTAATKHGFADALRQALYVLNPIIGHNAFGFEVRWAIEIDRVGYALLKEYYPEARRLLQVLGTEVGRQQWGADFWAQILMAKINLSANPWHVIADVRFPNELAAVREAGGHILWIDRPGVQPLNAHVSETSIGPTDCDYVLSNDGSLDDLQLKVEAHVINQIEEALK